MTDIVSQAIPCKFCGHRYTLGGCATQERADACGNFEWMNTRGDVGNLLHGPGVTHYPVSDDSMTQRQVATVMVERDGNVDKLLKDLEAMKLAAKIDAMIKGEK